MSDRTCTIDGCENKRKRAGGLCSTHYRHAVRAGEIDRNPRPCTVAGCTDQIPEELSFSGGMCTKHHKRVLRTGTTDDPEPYPTSCVLFYCDDPHFALGLCERHYKNEWQRNKDAARRAAADRNPPDLITCVRCRHSFERESRSKRPAKYCSACRLIRRREVKQRWAEQRRPESINEYTCKYCGCRFCHLVPDGRLRTICAGCLPHSKVVAAATYAERNPEKAARIKANGHALRRARLRGATVEPVDKVRVFERDGWVCNVCQLPINPELRYPHPMSASLDHVVPLAVRPEHTYANTAACHLVCNSRKGVRALDDVKLR